MVFVEIRPIPSLEMGSETWGHTKGAFKHLRKSKPKSLSKFA
jgi:hypothetical protein